MSQPRKGLKAGERHRGGDGKINLFRLAQKGSVDEIHYHLSELEGDKRRREARQPDARGICMLFHAIKHMRPKLVKHFFTCEVCMMEITMIDKEGQGVLHYAAKMVQRQEGDSKFEKSVEKVMNTLFKKGVDPMMKDTPERTPMHLAAANNAVLVAKHLVAMGSEGKNDEEEGKQEFIKQMLIDKDINWRTPLHEAVAQDNRVMVDFLFETALANGMPANDLISAKDLNGMSPLHRAALESNVNLVRVMVEAIDDEEERKITLDIIDYEGNTALCFAIENRCRELVDYLIAHGASTTEILGPNCDTVLHKACMAGEMSVMQTILSSHAKNELYEIDADESTPLHKAIEYMNYDAVCFLLKHKDWKPETPVSPCPATEDDEDEDENELEDENGEDGEDGEDGSNDHPFGISKHHSRNDIGIDMAGPPPYDEAVNDSINEDDKKVENDEDDDDDDDYDDDNDGEEDFENNMLEMADDENFTPLLSACCYNDHRVVDLLLNENADIKKKDHLERSPLVMACMYNQVKSVKHLLQHIKKSSDPKVKDILKLPDHNGNSPLHICAEHDNTECAKVCLENQAPLGVKNDVGETPFLTAVFHGSYETCELILDYTEGRCIHDNDEKFRTGLHIACKQGHLNVVKLLVTHKVDKQPRDETGRMPLDYAAEFGHLEIAKFLLNNDATIEADDEDYITPLQHACLNGHASMVKLFLDRGPESADVKTRYKDGLNALDMAIEKGQIDVAQTIMESTQWRVALMNAPDNSEFSDSSQEPRTSPLRNLIKNMPDVAKTVLDNCVKVKREAIKQDDIKKKPGDTDDQTKPADGPLKKEKINVDFNFEFIDDTYNTFSQWAFFVEEMYDDVWDDKELPKQECDPYTKKSSVLKNNHPLSLMVEYGRMDLLTHPLVLALIARKWKVAGLFYGSFFIFYAIFLSVLTAQLVRPDATNVTKCTTNTPDPSDFYDIAPYVLYGMSIFGICIEVFQLAVTRSKYLQSFTNFLDWFTYISTILVVTNFANCDRTDYIMEWQWVLGAFDVFFAWLNFILFLERFPMIGIYVVMVTEVFLSFMRFAVVLVLFILAFALSFYILLQNQAPFETVGASFVKTWVMMIGEMDYGDIFHGEEAGDPGTFNNYLRPSIVLFICFLVLLAIIINNIMTGLAVEDVTKLQEQARLKKIALQVDLALDVELAMPRRMQRYFQSVLRRKQYELHDHPSRWMSFVRFVERLLEAPLSRDHFLKKAISGKMGQTEHTDDLSAVEARLSRRLEAQDAKVDQIYNKLERLEALLLKRD